MTHQPTQAIARRTSPTGRAEIHKVASRQEAREVLQTLKNDTTQQILEVTLTDEIQLRVVREPARAITRFIQRNTEQTDKLFAELKAIEHLSDPFYTQYRERLIALEEAVSGQLKTNLQLHNAGFLLPPRRESWDTLHDLIYALAEVKDYLEWGKATRDWNVSDFTKYTSMVNHSDWAC
jgi:hypothetical protein